MKPLSLESLDRRIAIGRHDRFSRRQVLLAGIGATIWGLPPLARAQQDHCGVFRTLLEGVNEQRTHISVWAMSVAPGAVASARKKVAALRKALDGADKAVDQAGLGRLIAYANAAGTSIFVIAGLAGAAVPMLFAGSIVYGSGLIVIQALAGPQSVDGVTVARDVTVSRLGGLLGSVGDSADVVSGSTARFTQIGGTLVSAASVAVDLIAAARSSEEFQRARQRRQELATLLTAADAALKMLLKGTAAEEMRSACLDAIESDIRAIHVRTCPNVSLP